MATISPGGAYIGTPSPFLGKKVKPFSLLTRTISSSKATVKLRFGCRAQLIDAVHNLFVGVGVGLPCTVMECGDMIYRSTLPKSNGLTITAPGVALALSALSYLWATPGVAPGFFDMFVLAFVERLFRPTFRKVDMDDDFTIWLCLCVLLVRLLNGIRFWVLQDDFVLGKKLGEGSFGVVYRASLSKKRSSEVNQVLDQMLHV